LLNEPIVFFRDAAGVARGLAESCPHRFAPLHRGMLSEQDGATQLHCAYHGLAFSADGACIHNPHGKLPKAETRSDHRACASNTPDEFNALINSDPRHPLSGGMTTSQTEWPRPFAEYRWSIMVPGVPPLPRRRTRQSADAGTVAHRLIDCSRPPDVRP